MTYTFFTSVVIVFIGKEDDCITGEGRNCQKNFEIYLVYKIN